MIGMAGNGDKFDTTLLCKAIVKPGVVEFR